MVLSETNIVTSDDISWSLLNQGHMNNILSWKIENVKFALINQTKKKAATD